MYNYGYCGCYQGQPCAPVYTGCGCGGFGGGHHLAIILVLFILLVVAGCCCDLGCGCDDGCGRECEFGCNR